MNCRQAKDLIGAYIYGDLGPDEMRELRSHARECMPCREDLLSRGKIIASLDNSLPSLSDSERQRISWTVKGAVRKQQAPSSPLILRLAPSAALVALVLLTGFYAGKATSKPTRSVPSAVKSPARSAAKVEVKEMPAKKQKAADTTTELIDILRTFSVPVAVAPGTRETSPGRGQQQFRHPSVQPPDIVKIETGVKPTDEPKEKSGDMQNKTGDNEAEKLPRITDPKSAETTAPEEQ